MVGSLAEKKEREKNEKVPKLVEIIGVVRGVEMRHQEYFLHENAEYR